ncbi:glutamate-cysteine ligase family protein [Pseudonocardia eucalypti]|uniref:Glutamate-cysteine ligase family protein n=1 Tax=Pseudonocardia eucalypti TaxID=648755 RepID=A0ABP9QFB8_9PSEU|nr:gamma-glutamyl:cysteine ligase YbdK (ATP-grasp superfamily) [Pseudonocardia eucalypti]
MGRELARSSFTRAERQQYRGKVHRCLNALASMLRDGHFAEDTESTTGLEVELNLVDQRLDPAMRNLAVLDGVDSPELTSELGRWNVELNVPPRPLRGEQGRYLEHHVLDLLAEIEKQAGSVGAQVLTIGILPSLTERHLVADRLSPEARYTALNEQMLAARGEPFLLDIDGTTSNGQAPEHLHMDFDSIIPEAACTSLQLHLQVPPDTFAAHWNAAQCVSGVQVAVGANSPFLLGRRLWAETRVPLFLQATDVRSPELRNQGVRPRVWFGERWINSIFELFEENVRYFPGLLPVAEDQDPQAELAAGRIPALEELRLHNGTIWRWNRPIYDIADGRPHLRVENRVLPAGPTVVDMVANAMFFYGMLRMLTQDEQPIWARLPFAAAEQNFSLAAKDGLYASLYWPDEGWIRPADLVLRRLLPLAADGLAELGVADAVSGRYLDAIEARCASGRTGSWWQLRAVETLERRGADRITAIRGMLTRYQDWMRSNVPVHTWALP